MAAQGTVQQLRGRAWTGPGSMQDTAREAGRLPEVLRAVERGWARRWDGALRAWRAADRRGQGLDDRREQVRRDIALLGPRPW
ncbi:hypothetical protein [Sinomonas atrocyanea]|uniref:hypothetical protein n=1 Tax=Sinomonas atrocyanea TaxID=37927 RepID=UPI001663C0E5|nr:hypothetical protein [Sinomonas atrocyanea]GGG68497.1 hypothetical protein GCM10007172_20550 [Sinomonas atrocyanea]